MASRGRLGLPLTLFKNGLRLSSLLLMAYFARAEEPRPLALTPTTRLYDWVQNHRENSLLVWESSYRAWKYDSKTARYEYPFATSSVDALIPTPLQTQWSKDSFAAFIAPLGVAPRADLENWFYSEHLNRLTRSEVSVGNEVHLVGIDAILDIRLQAIRTARRSIWISTFLLNCDAGTESLIQALEAQAKNGISVRMLVDAAFSRTDPGCLKRLKNSGVSVARYPPGFLKIHHQKIGLIDGRFAWVSGDNLIGSQVAARSTNNGLRDAHLTIRGPAIHDLEKIFAGRWKLATDENLPLSARMAPLGHQSCRVIDKDAYSKDTRILHFLLEMISRAKTHLFYNNIQVDFDDPEKSSVGREILRLILRIANLRPGLRVDMQTNHSRRPTDPTSLPRKPMNLFETTLTWAGRNLLPSPLSEIEPARQSIRERLKNQNFHWWAYSGYQHAKTYSVDGVLTVLGSYNANDESQNQSTELMVACYSTELAHEHRQLYVLDWLNSIPIPLNGGI